MEYPLKKGYWESPVDGTRLFYETEGEGHSLLLCDGLLCDGHIWRYFVPALEEQCEFLHWHYPGHGRSDIPPGHTDLSPERLADDAAGLARHLGVGRTIVAGHSFGVQVALETWRRHPDLVEGLILLCGSPGHLVQEFHENAILEYVAPLLDAVVHLLPGVAMKMWRGLPVEPLLWAAYRFKEVNPRLLRSGDLADYFARLGKVDLRPAIRMLESAGRHDATDYLSEIDVPTLIIAAEQDRFTPPYRSRLMANRINGSELMMVPAGTHSLPIEMPDLVTLRVKRYLREHFSKGEAKTS